ncbi:hypothetical protein ACJMK2_037065 [Sinanodonta woodiana]|uniref:Alpha-mannosidase n=1 Tax=Sinanodonta woodiana TaxID=1069815 RepID=A0ABD3WJ41_SINWO
MKFPQRLVIVSAASCMLFVYIVILYSQALMQMWNSDQDVRIKRSLDQALNGRLGQTSTLELAKCPHFRFMSPNTTISTFDLPAKTNYKIYNNMQYLIPHQPLESAYYPDVEPLTVIVLPHSHVDPGWLRTIDDYYVYQVKNILNNMVKKLNMYRNMTFVWAETVFLSMWWNELDDDVKVQVRHIIDRGQLEIVLGGWVMPDEATTTYTSVIDQLVEGHQWLWENVQVRPKNSWSIDPFGHSGTMPYLWKLSGQDKMVIQRVHQAIKGTLAGSKSLEFYWQQYWDRSGKDSVLCHIMPYMLYSLHHTCGPDKFVCSMYDYRKVPAENTRVASKQVTEENVAEQAKYLYEQYRSKAGLYRYNTILVPLGDDFRYDFEIEWDQQYHNYNALMQYMNAQKPWKINVKFGTLEDYFSQIRREETRKRKWGNEFKFPVLSGDFFPYSDQNHAYWTGYYSTRPFDKRFSREVESILRSADLLHVMAYFYFKQWNKAYTSYHENTASLQQAHRNLALFLHHDAITGTAKPYVVQDYEFKLLQAYNSSQEVLGCALQALLSKGKFQSPRLFNPETIRSTFKDPSMRRTVSVVKLGTKVVFFNPLPYDRAEFVQLIVDTTHFEIRNSKNEVIPYQVNPIWEASTIVHGEAFEIVFHVHIPPLGVETCTLYPKDDSKKHWARISMYNTQELEVNSELKFEQDRPRHGGSHERVKIENQYLIATFETSHGMLQDVKDKRSGNTTSIHFDFLHYLSQGSGAYLFFPKGSASPFFQSIPVIRVITGPFVSEIQVLFPNLYHSIKLFNHPGLQGEVLHIQNALDMQVLNMKDREVIMRMSTDVKNKDLTFYTDQNGFQLIGRKTVRENRIETNYYPMTSMVVLEDQYKRLTLHSGQPHGTSSLEQGWVEVMLDRQLVYDDERGLGEGIFDNKLTMSKFILQIEYRDLPPDEEVKFTYPTLFSHLVSEHLQQPIQKVFTPINSDALAQSFLPSEQSLPCDVTILSLRNLINSDLVYNSTSFIVHRKNYICGFTSPPLPCSSSNTGTFRIKELLKDVKVSDLRETTLTHITTLRTVSSDELELSPMEIKSYLLSL